MARHKQPHLSLSKARSSITNGRHILPEIDARSAWMRRLRDLISLHVADLGGEALITEGERRLIRLAAMLCIQCEMLDAKFASEGGQASQNDLECYQRVTNTLRRTLETLGLERRSRDVTPTLKEYLDAKTRSNDDSARTA
jgi:hypothetical protein